MPSDVAARLAGEAATEAASNDVTERVSVAAQAYRRRVEAWLDTGYGSCVLGDERVASIIVGAWEHHDGERYDLHAWVVMPNHVHVLIRQRDGHPLPEILDTWKSYTAHAINRLLQRRGRLWQPDYWDRFVRDEGHYRQAVEYIHRNPVAAGLVTSVADWRWSSAGAAGTAAPPDEGAHV